MQPNLINCVSFFQHLLLVDPSSSRFLRKLLWQLNVLRNILILPFLLMGSLGLEFELEIIFSGNFEMIVPVPWTAIEKLVPLWFLILCRRPVTISHFLFWKLLESSLCPAFWDFMWAALVWMWVFKKKNPLWWSQEGPFLLKQISFSSRKLKKNYICEFPPFYLLCHSFWNACNLDIKYSKVIF